MRERAKMNAMRSGLVVVGALAFGYLTLQLGFRPYLERAQRTMDELQLRQSQSKSDGPTPTIFDHSSLSSATQHDTGLVSDDS